VSLKNQSVLRSYGKNKKKTASFEGSGTEKRKDSIVTIGCRKNLDSTNILNYMGGMGD
jgi:hypothetical protein